MEAVGSSPRVSVIIVAFNSGEHLQGVLDALAAQTFGDYELILLDNASPTRETDFVRLPESSRVLTSAVNLGFAGGNNYAAAHARAPFLVLLNPDAYPRPDWLGALVRCAEETPDAAAIGSVQLDAADPLRLDGLGDAYHIAGIPYRGGYGAPAPESPDGGEIFGPCAAAALYRRDAFDNVGGFDERFFCYCEDVDLAFRLRRAGWRARLASDAVVEHVGSASSGRRSRFAVYHGVRNRLWTLLKNMPLLLLIPSLALHILVVGGLWALACARSGEEARATGAGLRDGLAGAGDIWRSRTARTASLASLVGAFTWSPWKLMRRGADVRPWRSRRP